MDVKTFLLRWGPHPLYIVYEKDMPSIRPEIELYSPTFVKEEQESPSWSRTVHIYVGAAPPPDDIKCYFFWNVWTRQIHVAPSSPHPSIDSFFRTRANVLLYCRKELEAAQLHHSPALPSPPSHMKVYHIPSWNEKIRERYSHLVHETYEDVSTACQHVQDADEYVAFVASSWCYRADHLEQLYVALAQGAWMVTTQYVETMLQPRPKPFMPQNNQWCPRWFWTPDPDSVIPWTWGFRLTPELRGEWQAHPTENVRDWIATALLCHYPTKSEKGCCVMPLVTAYQEEHLQEEKNDVVIHDWATLPHSKVRCRMWSTTSCPSTVRKEFFLCQELEDIPSYWNPKGYPYVYLIDRYGKHAPKNFRTSVVQERLAEKGGLICSSS
jgi:hypothetical protein